MTDDPLIAAVVRSIDAAVLRREIAAVQPKGASTSTPAAAVDKHRLDDVLQRIVLADLLDDSILGARPGESSFPLRVFFGTIGDHLGDDTAFALASGLNFFFRAEMDEEWKMRLGVEVTQLYYRFVAEGHVEPQTARAVSPLLAALLNTELKRVRLDSIDGTTVFDSALHEREPGSDLASSSIKRPVTMLCRVLANNTVRAKARVRT